MLRANETAVRAGAVVFAVAVHGPKVALAVTVIEAKPSMSVVAVAADRVPEAPDAGTENATLAPITGLPAASVTLTISGAGNWLPGDARLMSGDLPPCA